MTFAEACSFMDYIWDEGLKCKHIYLFALSLRNGDADCHCMCWSCWWIQTGSRKKKIYGLFSEVQI